MESNYSESIKSLRSSPAIDGPVGIKVVVIPKRARDWLCDEAERAETLEKMLTELLDCFNTGIHYNPAPCRKATASTLLLDQISDYLRG